MVAVAQFGCSAPNPLCRAPLHQLAPARASSRARAVPAHHRARACFLCAQPASPPAAPAARPSLEFAQLGFLLGHPPFPSVVVSPSRVLSRLFLHACPDTSACYRADRQQLSGHVSVHGTVNRCISFGVLLDPFLAIDSDVMTFLCRVGCSPTTQQMCRWPPCRALYRHGADAASSLFASSGYQHSLSTSSGSSARCSFTLPASATSSHVSSPAVNVQERKSQKVCMVR